MKLIQLNCWTGRLASTLNNFLKEEDPDILCIQEAVDLPKGDDIVFLTIDWISQAMKAKDVFLSPVFSFKFMRRKAMFGNAILSKYPILKKDVLFTHGEFVDDLDYADDGSNMRNMQHVVVNLPGNKKLNVLNHHGYHIEHHKKGDEQTLRQCKIIADYTTKIEDKPVVLTGDFNLSPDSESIQQIDRVLHNLVVKSGAKTTRNILSNKTEVCDYIFVNDKVKVKNFVVSDAIVSDHKALIIEFCV